MAKKRLIGLVFGTCDRCGETHFPLTYHKITKQWLDDDCLKLAKLVPKAQKRIKQWDEEKEIFDTLTANF